MGIRSFLGAKEHLLSGLSDVIGCDKILEQVYGKICENPEGYCDQKALDLLDVLLETLHDNLHSGEWHLVDCRFRKAYSVASYFKVLVQLNKSDSLETLDECAYIIDLAIMLGDTLKHDNEEILQTVATLLTKEIALKRPSSSSKRLKVEPVQVQDVCDVPCASQPSIEHFIEAHYVPQKPVLLRNVIDDWPALEKWKDLSYLIEKAGSRTVPIELGSQYTSENWSQSLVGFREFVESFILHPEEPNVGYLAQHDLFDQIPELKEDIRVPEYISSEPRVKAWLGPKGTVSPLHTDPTHNLLCQVFGSKKVILAAPADTEKLYPHEHFILHNTSQIDAEKLDFERFPLTRDVTFLTLTLNAGEVLYIPPKWWHHIRSLSPSFSVSYWFD